MENPEHEAEKRNYIGAATTPRQYAHLEALREGEQTGAEMRRCLKTRGGLASRDAFYKVMERLLELRFVTSRHIARDNGRAAQGNRILGAHRKGPSSILLLLRILVGQDPEFPAIHGHLTHHDTISVVRLQVTDPKDTTPLANFEIDGPE